MGQKILIGAPIDKAVKTDRTAFAIDNDSFPIMQNAYQWRGRVKRKRGTAFLCQLTSYFSSAISTYFSPPNSLQLNGAGQGNIITFYGFVEESFAITGIIINPTNCVISAMTNFNIGDEIIMSGIGGTIQLNGNVYIVAAVSSTTFTITVNTTGFTPYTVGGTAMLNIPNITIQPGSVVITTFPGGIVYTDDGMGNMLNSVPAVVGSINYISGLLTIASLANTFIDSAYNYFTMLPVMGLEDFANVNTQFPTTIGFDTRYAYSISNASVPSSSYSVSFFKNVRSNTYTGGQTQKNQLTQAIWNGKDYQQFWTANYEGAMWTTNGITIPFNPTNIGMSYEIPSAVAFVDAHTVIFTILILDQAVIINDFIFTNEFTAAGGAANAQTLNLQTGYVIATSTSGDNRLITVYFPNAAIANDTYSNGMIQLLTKQVKTNLDQLRWYDGDPTAGAYPPASNSSLGWTNFAPPLSLLPYSIADQPAAIYYLVGARMIFPFRDRLVFIGPVIQTSVANSAAIYLQDTVIFSQNGTPYYTASFQGNPILANTIFTPILTPGTTVPAQQIASPCAYFCDQPGFGGWAQVGIDEKINTVSLNENVLIFGMDTHQVRMVYTSNDLNPFNFYIINSELGSSSTFSAINMDKGVLTRGDRGFVVCSQVETQRFDLDIPDEVFQINTLNQGLERISGIRDFINEWVQFTFPGDSDYSIFPNQTWQYNYRDRTWATFYESYTTYGNFRISQVITWATLPYSSWADWNDPWDAGASNEGQPLVIGGNQQGFVLVKGEGEGTSEGTSLLITAFNGSTVSCPNHCLFSGDFINISGCIGSIGSYVNGFTFQVTVVDNDSFMIAPLFNTGTYLGNGYITRNYVPFIQTKQFPVSWEMARKTRLGPSMYLLTKTDKAQMTLLIYLSQNSSFAYNVFPPNNALIYSTVLYTCPESSNLGLTPANTNLQMVTASSQSQIWHRINESLLGDTVQLGFTVSDAQMLQIDPVPNTTFIVSGATNANPCVLTCIGMFAVGSLIQINLINGMDELNYDSSINNFYSVISADGTYVTINIDSTGFGVFTLSPNAIATQYAYTNQFTEIELHGIIMDVNPSMVLA